MPELPDYIMVQVPQIAESIHVSRYLSAAGIVVMLYDWILMLPTEVEQIWTADSWGAPSILFLINRYPPIPVLLFSTYNTALLHQNDFSDQVCKGAVSVSIVGWAIAQATSTWLLSLRVITLYTANKPIKLTIYMAYFSAHLVMTIFTSIIFVRLMPTTGYYTPINMCASINSGLLAISTAYLPPFILEFFILILQVIHHYTRNRVYRKHNVPTFGLVRTLYMDGYYYFGACLLMRIATLLSWQGTTNDLIYLPNQFEFGMTVMFAARFHLHLRKVAHQRATASQTTDALTGFSIGAAQPSSQLSETGPQDETSPSKVHTLSMPSSAALVTTHELDSELKDEIPEMVLPRLDFVSRQGYIDRKTFIRPNSDGARSDGEIEMNAIER